MRWGKAKHSGLDGYLVIYPSYRPSPFWEEWGTEIKFLLIIILVLGGVALLLEAKEWEGENLAFKVRGQLAASQTNSYVVFHHPFATIWSVGKVLNNDRAAKKLKVRWSGAVNTVDISYGDDADNSYLIDIVSVTNPGDTDYKQTE